MFNLAYAMGTGGAGGAADGGGFTAFVPLILMFAIFYFLLIRPQQKKAKEHQAMINALKKGDRVITSGGIHGRITTVDDTTITLEVAEKVKIKVSRGNVGTIIPGTAPVEKK
ncbi:MAG: preprotein translocase subunit YajC [Pseudomonadota bacterium]